MPPLSRLRLLIISGDKALQLGLLTALREEGAVEIEQLENFPDAVRGLQMTFHDCVIIDKELGEGDGLVLAPVVKRINPKAAIFLITENVRWATIEAAKDLGFTEVLGREKSVLELSQSIAEQLRRSSSSFQSKLELLSLREREILKDIATGKRTLEIAANRHISEGTIKSHLSSIYRKLGVRNRVEAIAAIKS
jgi:two-component system response regulator DesR